MTKAKRGLWSYRIACISLLGVMGGALSACGGDSGSASTGTTTSQNSPGSTSTGGTSNVTLQWSPPTENTDGTALTNLVGYKIHYGTASQTYTDEVPVDNPGIATYVVENLPSGTYYFAVGAYNADGVESLLSDEVSASLN
jgi:hypothetical protein